MSDRILSLLCIRPSRLPVNINTRQETISDIQCPVNYDEIRKELKKLELEIALATYINAILQTKKMNLDLIIVKDYTQCLVDKIYDKLNNYSTDIENIKSILLQYKDMYVECKTPDITITNTRLIEQPNNNVVIGTNNRYISLSELLNQTINMSGGTNIKINGKNRKIYIKQNGKFVSIDSLHV